VDILLDNCLDPAGEIAVLKILHMAKNRNFKKKKKKKKKKKNVMGIVVSLQVPASCSG